jgi:hypothetical protein
MKRFLLLLVVVLVFGFVWWTSRRDDGGGGKAPDEQLAEHTRAMCKIAKAGIDHPDDGVRKLFRYYGQQGPAIASEWAHLLVLIERIDDDRKHDDRARLAARRIHAPAIACQRTFQRFADAVEDDEAASARLQRGVDRLGRTLEILFGQDGGALAPVPFAATERLDLMLRAATVAPR